MDIGRPFRLPTGEQSINQILYAQNYSLICFHLLRENSESKMNCCCVTISVFLLIVLTTNTLTFGQKPLLTFDPICKQSNDCGENAFCEPTNRTCQCKLGYLNSGDGTNCAPVACSSQSQCHDRWGSGTNCNKSSLCTCDASYQLESTTQKCLPLKRALAEQCAQNFNCGSGAFCALSDNRCHCRFGGIESAFNEVNCDPLQCFEDTDCVQFSGDVVCNQHNCQCAPGFQLDSFKQLCKKKPAPE